MPSMSDHALTRIVGGTKGLTGVPTILAFAPYPIVPHRNVSLHSSSTLISVSRRRCKSWIFAYRPRSRNVVFACEQPPESVEKSPLSATSRRTSLQKTPSHANMPTLFQKPEAVLGIVIAAAALLTDFARNLVRLSLRTRPTRPALSAQLNDVESSISSLQEALDVSKEALADTERSLDAALARASTAESAIASMDDTRAALAFAREQVSGVDDRLTNAHAALRSQATRRNNARADANALRDERDRLALTVAQREKELDELCQQLDDIRNKEDNNENNPVETSSSMINDLRSREKQLLEDIQLRDEQLKTIRQERIEVEEEAKIATARVNALEGEAEAASRALQETQSELERLSKEAALREQELVRMEQESTELAKRTEEYNRLHDVYLNMERELKEMQEELSTRDRVVEDTARESDTLRGLLAARDAEVRQLEARLDSAISMETDRGGDPSQSDRNLQDVTASLEAEQLALSAEIAHAELSGLDLSAEQISALDKVSKQIDVKEKRLEAKVRMAESKLRRQQQNQERKENAVHEIMESVEDELLQQNAAMQWPPVYPSKYQLGNVGAAEDLTEESESSSESVDVETDSNDIAATDSSSDHDEEKEKKLAYVNDSSLEDHGTDATKFPAEEWGAEDDVLYKVNESSVGLKFDQHGAKDSESNEMMEFLEYMSENNDVSGEEVQANIGYSIENASKDETGFSEYSDEQLRDLLSRGRGINDKLIQNWMTDSATASEDEGDLAAREILGMNNKIRTESRKSSNANRNETNTEGNLMRGTDTSFNVSDNGSRSKDPNGPKIEGVEANSEQLSSDGRQAKGLTSKEVVKNKRLKEKGIKSAPTTRKKTSKSVQQMEEKQDIEKPTEGDDSNRSKRKRGRPKKVKT